MSVILRWFLLAAVLAFCSSLAVFAGQEAEQLPQLKFQATLIDPPEYARGERIILYTRLMNCSETTLRMESFERFLEKGFQNYEISVTRLEPGTEEETDVSLTRYGQTRAKAKRYDSVAIGPPPPPERGGRQIKKYSEGYGCLNRYFDLTLPGRYTLTFRRKKDTDHFGRTKIHVLMPKEIVFVITEKSFYEK